MLASGGPFVLVLTLKMLVTIPTCGESAHLGKLVQMCREGGADVIVVVNNVTPEQCRYVEAQVIGHGLLVSGGGGVRSLYTIWNQCLELTRQDDVGAILNDDIEVHPDSFQVVSSSVKAGNPVVGWEAFTEPSPSPLSKLRPVHGTYRTRGLAGFAFAFDPHRVPSFDEGFTWWYGDDDWVEQCKQNGLPLAVESNCGIKHYTSTSQRARPWVMRDVAQDKQRFEFKWGKK